MAGNNGQPAASRSADSASNRIRPHERWIRTILASRVGDASVVDDLMQEIYLAAINKSLQFASIKRIEPWLYRVAVRLALQHRRRAGRHRRRLASIYLERTDGVDTPIDPFDWLATREAQDKVRRSLARLASVDRDLLMLKYAHGWTYQKISDRLGVTISTIEYRLLRARKRLRRLITDSCTEEMYP